MKKLSVYVQHNNNKKGITGAGRIQDESFNKA